MKQVLGHKRRFTYRDVINYLFVGVGHYSMMIIFALIAFGIRYAISGYVFELNRNPIQGMVWYSIVIGPGVNTLLHIWFSERGLPLLRFAMWFHTFACFIMIGIGA